MKITSKQLKLIASVISLAGIVIAAITNRYNKNHPADPNTYGFYIGIGIALFGMVLQAP